MELLVINPHRPIQIMCNLSVDHQEQLWNAKFVNTVTADAPPSGSAWPPADKTLNTEGYL